MKKVYGLLMLLLLAFLVSLPVAADGLAPSNDHALVITTDETKIAVEEEVAGIPGEMVAAPAVAPIPAVENGGHTTMIEPDAGFEAGSILLHRSRKAGGIRPSAGFT
jgi:hypothetical protein